MERTDPDICMLHKGYIPSSLALICNAYESLSETVKDCLCDFYSLIVLT